VEHVGSGAQKTGGTGTSLATRSSEVIARLGGVRQPQELSRGERRSAVNGGSWALRRIPERPVGSS